MLLTAIALAAAGPVLHFDLEPATAQEGRVAVAPDKSYSANGFGYEPERQGSQFLFSAAVPEGNYKVTVKVSGRVTIKAENRRLMVRDLVTRPGKYVTTSFIVLSSSRPPSAAFRRPAGARRRRRAAPAPPGRAPPDG